MDQTSSLAALLEKGFETAGERVAVGFDPSRIRPTLSKLPASPGDDLLSLFTTTWPVESFFLGAIELLGPDRINEEPDVLLPGCLIVKFGFLCFGSDGGGGMYSYCLNNRKVYLIPHEYVAEDAVYAQPWERLDPSEENIKTIAEQSWPSLDALFEWARVELEKIAAGGGSDED
jgi:hypothetical protein